MQNAVPDMTGISWVRTLCLSFTNGSISRFSSPPPLPPRPLSTHIIDAQKWEENIQMSGRKMGYFLHFCCNIFSLKVRLMRVFLNFPKRDFRPLSARTPTTRYVAPFMYWNWFTDLESWPPTHTNTSCLDGPWHTRRVDHQNTTNSTLKLIYFKHRVFCTCTTLQMTPLA